MKKIILFLVLILILCGCQKKNDLNGTQQTINNETQNNQNQVVLETTSNEKTNGEQYVFEIGEEYLKYEDFNMDGYSEGIVIKGVWTDMLEENDEYNDINVNAKNSNVRVTYTIPSTIDGKKVVAIEGLGKLHIVYDLFLVPDVVEYVDFFDGYTDSIMKFNSSSNAKHIYVKDILLIDKLPSDLKDLQAHEIITENDYLDLDVSDFESFTFGTIQKASLENKEKQDFPLEKLNLKVNSISESSAVYIYAKNITLGGEYLIEEWDGFSLCLRHIESLAIEDNSYIKNLTLQPMGSELNELSLGRNVEIDKLLKPLYAKSSEFKLIRWSTDAMEFHAYDFRDFVNKDTKIINDSGAPVFWSEADEDYCEACRIDFDSFYIDVVTE